MARKYNALIEAKELVKIQAGSGDIAEDKLNPFLEKLSHDLAEARTAGKNKLRVKVTSWPLDSYKLGVLFVEAGYDVETQLVKSDVFITLGWPDA